MISIDEFSKIDLCVGQIETAESIEGADKILKLQVNIGAETRQMVAGVAEAYGPEQLEGKRVVAVVNLKPATLRGVVSEGMVLAAVDPDGKPSIVWAPEDVPLGSRVR